MAPTFALLHPPERPGYVAYVWQNHTFLLAIHTLLAVVWEREQQQRIPLLVVRHWDCPALFSPALAQEFAAYGLTVEVVQGKIFVREAPRWIMRFDLWMIIRELFLFWPTQLKLPPAQRWALFWRELDLTPPHLEKFNLRDATLAHLLRELPLAIHERYGEQIFATAAAPSLLNTHDTYTSHGDAVISDERDNYV